MAEEKAYPIACTCGAVVRLRAWALHLKHGDPSRLHLAPWESKAGAG